MFIALASTGFTIGFLYFLLVAPYLLAKGMYLLEMGYIDRSDKLQCMIPIYNLYLAEKMYHGGFPKIAASSFIALVTFIIRLLIMFLAPANVFAALIVLAVFVVSFLIFWATSAILVYKLLDKTTSVYGLKKLLYVVLFPLGEFYIGNYLAIAIHNDVKSKEAIL